MRGEKNADGSRRFAASEYLTWKQITSYFSRYAAQQRNEPIRGRRGGNWDDDVQQDEYVGDPLFPTTEEIVHESIQQHHAEIFEAE